MCIPLFKELAPEHVLDVCRARHCRFATTRRQGDQTLYVCGVTDAHVAVDPTVRDNPVDYARCAGRTGAVTGEDFAGLAVERAQAERALARLPYPRKRR